jgi:RHS repeat-associated protein
VTYTYSADGREVTGATPLTFETRYRNVRGQPDSVKTRYSSWDYWRSYNYRATGQLDSLYATGSWPPFTSRKHDYLPDIGRLQWIRLAGSGTGLGWSGDFLSTSTYFPGIGNYVVRDHMSLHGQMEISSPAAYGSEVARKLGFSELGQVSKQLREPVKSGHLYAYDALGRLLADTVATWTAAPPCDLDPDFGAECDQSTWARSDTTVFAYDEVGNRTDNGGSYTTGNRLAAFGSCTHLNNPDGTRLRNYCPGTSLGFEWDAEGRLKWVMFDYNGPQWVDTVKFFYDAFGRLFRKDWNSTVQSYLLWDGDQLFAELGSDGNVRAEYSYYPGQDAPHAVIVDGTHYYALADGLGNVVALTDSGQTVQRTYQYDAWGQLTGGTDPGGLANRDRARWKGALWLGPEADLYYMRHRWYEPATGRFLSEDPIGLSGGINPYTYAGNDPVNGSDPTGLIECTEYVTGRGYWRNGKFVMLEEYDRFLRCEDTLIGGDQPGGGVPAADAPSAQRQLGPTCSDEAAQFIATLALDLGTVYLGGPAARLALRGVSNLAAGGLIRAATAVRTGAHLGRAGLGRAWGSEANALVAVGAAEAAVGGIGIEAAYDVRQVVFGGAGSGSLGIVDFLPFGPSAKALIALARCRGRG